MSRRIADGWHGLARNRAKFIFLWGFLLLAQPLFAAPTYHQDADLIRHTYETQLYTLPAQKMGHYGLRMYRQTRDPKYTATIWSDMARIASAFNRFAAEVTTPEQIAAYSAKRIERYSRFTSVRGQLRYQVTKDSPEYLYVAMDLVRPMARLLEYGLKHQQDAQFREIIRRYDFTEYVTSPDMIRAWAAQLANQAYFLRQLGEQDVVEPFIDAFRATYPDSKDSELSDFQFINKLYGMTHMVIAESEYYQKPVKEADHQWIFDYYRAHIDTILKRSKLDVYAEVAINFLLADLEADPVVDKIRQAIQQSIDRDIGLIPGVTGQTGLLNGEHRNVLAIMVLDWQSPNVAPTLTDDPKVFRNIPYGLIPR